MDGVSSWRKWPAGWICACAPELLPYMLQMLRCMCASGWGFTQAPKGSLHLDTHSAGVRTRTTQVRHRGARREVAAAGGPADAAGPPHPIQLIATDVDGTLLQPNQTLSPVVARAVRAAAAVGVPVGVNVMGRR